MKVVGIVQRVLKVTLETVTQDVNEVPAPNTQAEDRLDRHLYSRSNKLYGDLKGIVNHLIVMLTPLLVRGKRCCSQIVYYEHRYYNEYNYEPTSIYMCLCYYIVLFNNILYFNPLSEQDIILPQF